MASDSYKPLADKAHAEVKAFVRLSRRNPWLAIALLCCVVGWGVFPLVGWFNRGAKIDELKNEVGLKSARIQELETQLTPFKTIAFDRFSKADAEALKRLAETIISLQNDYSNQFATIESLRVQLERVRKTSQKRGELLTANSHLVLADLKKMKPRRVACSVVPGDGETVDFAKTLLAMFSLAGWESVNVVNQMQIDEFNEQFIGVTVYVPGSNKNHQDCIAIHRLLTSIGIQCRIGQVDNYFDKPYDPEKEILLNLGRIDR